MYKIERDALVERFGGITAHMRSPAKGLWKDGGKTTKDDMVILEVMVKRVDRKWWNDHRHKLQKPFQAEGAGRALTGHEAALALSLSHLLLRVQLHHIC
jgi:hypothetical protein